MNPALCVFTLCGQFFINTKNSPISLIYITPHFAFSHFALFCFPQSTAKCEVYVYFNYSFLCISSYKHALDGIIRISREEGILKLFNGVQWASTRAVAVTIGQLCFYDLVKAQLLKTAYFEDNLTTHFTSSLCAVSFFLLNKDLLEKRDKQHAHNV